MTLKSQKESRYSPFHATFNTEFLSCCHHSGSQHKAARGSCVEEDRSRFHGSQDRLSQSVDGVHGAAAQAARMRSAWMRCWGWEHWTALCWRVLKVAWNRLYSMEIDHTGVYMCFKGAVSRYSVIFFARGKMAIAHASVGAIRPGQLGQPRKQLHRPSWVEKMSFSSSTCRDHFPQPCPVAAIIFPHTQWLPKITDYRDTAALISIITLTFNSWPCWKWEILIGINTQCQKSEKNCTKTSFPFAVLFIVSTLRIAEKSVLEKLTLPPPLFFLG